MQATTSIAPCPRYDLTTTTVFVLGYIHLVWWVGWWGCVKPSALARVYFVVLCRGITGVCARTRVHAKVHLILPDFQAVCTCNGNVRARADTCCVRTPWYDATGAQTPGTGTVCIPIPHHHITVGRAQTMGCCIAPLPQRSTVDVGSGSPPTDGAEALARVQLREYCRRDHRGWVVMRREWLTSRGLAHRMDGPACEQWLLLADGQRVRMYTAWFMFGRLHRIGGPALRRWRLQSDGTLVEKTVFWAQFGAHHRADGPSGRHWVVLRNGSRVLTYEEWTIRGTPHSVDGAAALRDGLWSCFWRGKPVNHADLPWLRRGQCVLAALLTRTPGFRSVAPAWVCDRRFNVWAEHGNTFHSVVGGLVVLCT